MSKQITEKEFEERFQYYLKNMTGEVSPPECTDCSSLAEYTDLAEGENYCEKCLKRSLRRDMDFFIQNTIYKE